MNVWIWTGGLWLLWARLAACYYYSPYWAGPPPRYPMGLPNRTLRQEKFTGLDKDIKHRIKAFFDPTYNYEEPLENNMYYLSEVLRPDKANEARIKKMGKMFLSLLG